MKNDLTLTTIDTVDKDKQAHVRAKPLPIIKGPHEGDVNCGGCGTTIAQGAGPQVIHALFQTEQELVFECTCGALNLVPREA
ncbi:hypothetical protein WJT74_08940 [Sphingomicrobium sp. XHP0239]|uniref:hypothetical protein n=1 Tax=Sphingomicrobium maritimum TaxID=3133972 RepID=UPI0031CC4361